MVQRHEDRFKREVQTSVTQKNILRDYACVHGYIHAAYGIDGMRDCGHEVNGRRKPLIMWGGWCSVVAHDCLST